ncbi:uncharacterized protein FTOL_08163 [Fusarium torulosum]|uniref:Uncharacterized protein n=1 Tax=Fusarium torulosum TaxID=33205 RepID=A0AAE8MCS6_9HYPO|nr:uncharacterized protein FTOL_08163 [Fusarium torulosum]
MNYAESIRKEETKVKKVKKVHFEKAYPVLLDEESADNESDGNGSDGQYLLYCYAMQSMPSRFSLTKEITQTHQGRMRLGDGPSVTVCADTGGGKPAGSRQWPRQLPHSTKKTSPVYI